MTRRAHRGAEPVLTAAEARWPGWALTWSHRAARAALVDATPRRGAAFSGAAGRGHR
jgi:hypothetical protein